MTYKPYGLQALSEELERDEGKRDKPYQDSVGKTTIGIGRNLDDVGLSNEEIYSMLAHDIDRAEQTLDSILPEWRLVNAIRQRALLNMALNLGETRLRGFRLMWAAIGSAIALRDGNSADSWTEAAAQALDSKWAGQVGVRATRIATMLRSGEPVE